MAGVLHCRARVVSYLPGLHVLVSRVGAAGGVLSGNKPVVSDQSSILSSDLGGQLESTVPSGPQEPNVLLLLRGGDGGCGRHQDASRRVPLATPAPGGEEEESVICHYFEGLLTKTEKANDEKDRLLLKKMEESDTKAHAQQKVFLLMKGQEECKEEFSTALVQNEILQISQRQQDLQGELKSLQLQLKDKRLKSTELSQRFKVVAKSPRTKINFTGRNQEERTNRSELIRGVFAVSQRPFVLLQGQHALITFEEEKVASQVLKMPRCPVSAGADRLFVKPKKVALKPASKFEVHLSTCRKTLKVSNIHSTLPKERIRDRLEISFSRPSQGGGEVESLEYNEDLGTGQVTFLQPGVSETLALKGSYRVDLESGVNVEVGPSYKQQLDNFQTFSCSSERTILLADIEDNGDVEDLQDQLEIHFQKPGNGGGEIEDIVYVPKGEALQAIFLCEAMETEGNQS